jgi:hypothetical protein
MSSFETSGTYNYFCHMIRSILKSMSVNEFNWILSENKVQDNVRAELIVGLFENPQTEKIYLLKPQIRTLDDLKNNVKTILGDNDLTQAVINFFCIKDDLKIPSDLRDVFLSNKKMAFFIGAGVSKLLDIPLWDELANKAIERMRDNSYINHSEAARLQNEKYPPKQIMSIFHKTVCDSDGIKKFYEEYLKGKETDKINPYELLWQLEESVGKPIVKISTNIDLEWEKVLKIKADKQKLDQTESGGLKEPQILFNEIQYENFTRQQKIGPENLYKIHGTLKEIHKAIITTPQYVDTYREENGLKGFLEKLFREYTVLFIGSGMQEFEILEHLLKKDSPTEHFSLVGTQFSETNLFRIKQSYFTGIKIKAIPYYLDFQSYDRLLYVLQSWIDEIKSSKNNAYYENTKLIDEAIAQWH